MKNKKFNIFGSVHITFHTRTRDNARFHLKKKGKFYIIRDTTEVFTHTWRYVQD